MENKKTFRELLTIGEVITTQEGNVLLVYEATERYAFLAPVGVTEDGVVVHIADTVVYDITVDGDETSPILDVVIPMGGADHEE